MAREKLSSGIEELNGATSPGHIHRVKRYRDARGRIIGVGVQETYDVLHPRDWNEKLRMENETQPQPPPSPLSSRHNSYGGFSFFRSRPRGLRCQPQPLKSPLPSRLNPDGGFSFFRSRLRGLRCQPQPLNSPLPSRFNPDGGFSFFRAKERKSPRKKERKPGCPVTPEK